MGRRYNEGIHQAIEAKEGVEDKAENQTLANRHAPEHFRLYQKLSGMTGTAETEAPEFIVDLQAGVVPIPTNKPMQRIDQTDLVYKNEKAKFEQVAEDIAERHEKGQPVLVGTTSVEKSEYLSKLLAKKGVKHEVHNAKNHAREAAIVAQAGRLGAVTVDHEHGRPVVPTSCWRQLRCLLAVQDDARQGPVADGDPGGVRGRLGRRLRRASRQRSRTRPTRSAKRRSLRPRYRAPRVPPHRQPAARSFRSPGRPGREPVSTCRSPTT